MNKPSQKWSVYPKAGDIKRPFKPIWTVMPHDSCVIMDGQSTKSERSRMKNWWSKTAVIDSYGPVHFDLQLCSSILTSIFTVHFYFSLWSSTFTVYLHRPFLHFTLTVHFDRSLSSSILTVFYSSPIQKNFRDRPVYEYEPEYESEEIETFQMEEASYDCRDHIAW